MIPPPGMDLALAVGRNGRAPLVREKDVVVLGRKDEADEPFYGVHSLRRSAVQDLAYEQIRTRGVQAVTEDALRRLGRTERRGC